MIKYDPKEVTINGRKYYIHPFMAFKSTNIIGDLTTVIAPVLTSVLPVFAGKSLLDVDTSELAAALPSAFDSLSGDKLEKIIRKLIIDNQNVAVDVEGKAVWLNEDIANECFAINIKDMFELVIEVVKFNYGGFFGKLGSLYGLAGQSQTALTSKNTEPLTSGGSPA